MVDIGKFYYCKNCNYKWQSKKTFGEPAFCPKCKYRKIEEVKPIKKEGTKITFGLFGTETRELKDVGNHYILIIHKTGLFNDNFQEIKIPKNDYEKIEKYKIKEMLNKEEE